MSHLSSPLEIYKLLPKSNCRECCLPTCLAFADAVIKGKKNIRECPHLDKDIIKEFDGKITKPKTIEEQQEQFLRQLKKEIVSIDLPSSAERLGAVFSGGKLRIKSLGKEFAVDPAGNITSECHINTWLTIPLLNYIISCNGKNVVGKWVPFRELKNGKARQPLFEQRCEKPLKKLADTHPDLFENIIYIFSASPVTSFDADISLVLHPLPKIPMLINYYRPADDIESKLNIFFDITAADNLNIESIHMLCTGLVTMFERIAFRHG